MTAREDVTVEEREVRVPVGPVELEGNLGVPDDAREVVLFAHGSASRTDAGKTGSGLR